MIKAVIFDLDDTLCNTSDVLEQALHKAFEENLAHFPGKTPEEMIKLDYKAFNEIFSDENISAPTGLILVWFRIFENLNIHPPIKAIHQITSTVQKELLKKLKPTKGTKELFEFLKSKNIKIGVLTNGIFWHQIEKLVALNIDKDVDYIVTPDMCLADKPDPKAFHYILDKLHLKPEETLMVGDGLTPDIAGAHGVGMRAILIRSVWKEYTLEEEQKADLVIDNLVELKQYLSTLLQR